MGTARRRAPALTAVAAALWTAATLGSAAGAGSGDVVVNSLGMRMVLVPAGTFQMGSPAGEPLRQEEETPRRVTLTRPFRIAATEVTQVQWLALMPWNRSQHQGDDLPVTSVSWKDAREFCVKLSEREGAPYRLATEAEWEYACRAGAAEVVSRAERPAVAWYAENSGGMTHPVAGREPNAWGLFDMLGNVAEWTLDAYGPYPHAEEEQDPAGPAAGTTRVVRGGAWRSFPPAVRCAARIGTPSAHQLHHVGLRVVQEVQ
ncbi:MAG: formylglycine-generating enzyme family protein [Acidobacteria bacterium]|jgi:formylglycine-generating enzyme required for sulfatase activity|nr:formylglycine-generating enzyme family protein [Acidobacteriota bacterium]